MSVQYKDGSFGEIKNLTESMEEFINAIAADTAKALHVGTQKEIEKTKRDIDLGSRITELESKIADIETENSELVVKPNYKEIKKYSRKCSGHDLPHKR